MKTVIITLTIIILTISKPIYSDENKICFYTEDKFKGDSICLAPNQKIDLYQDSATAVKSDSNLTPINNDSIQSITVPPEMTATIYKNDNYIPPFFELQENITNNSLKALGMSRMITSIKVSKKEGLNCDQQCVIINNHTIKLADVFDKYWNDARLKNKQILLVFNTIELGVDDNYEIVLFNGANININNSRVSFTNVKMNDGIYFERYQRSDNLSFIIQIDEDIVQVQYLQTLKNRLVNTSPIIFFDWDSHLNVAPEIIITNYNKHKPLVIAKTILTADTGDKDWEKRDLVQTSKILCAFTPF